MTTKQLDVLKLNRKNGLQYLNYILNTVQIGRGDDVCRIANEKIAEGDTPLLAELQRTWYKTLRAGNPDYSVYDAHAYIAEAYVCWFEYSRKYLNQIQKPSSLPPYGVADQSRTARVIVDLGNGLGFTTAALTQIFPTADVYGTNVTHSLQYRVAAHLATEYRFRMAADAATINRTADLVFASEYFEHFHDPITHLHEIINALQPRRLLLANTFANDGIGHFDHYQMHGETIHGRKAGRFFNNELRSLGYHKIKTTLWNNKPNYWERA